MFQCVIPCLFCIVLLIGYFAANSKLIWFDMNATGVRNTNNKNDNHKLLFVVNLDQSVYLTNPLKTIGIFNETNNKHMGISSEILEKSENGDPKSLLHENTDESTSNKSSGEPSERKQEKVFQQLQKSLGNTEIKQYLRSKGNFSCKDTYLSRALENSSTFKLSDFDCSVSNDGWRENLPPPVINSSRAEKEWKKRMNVIHEFAQRQDEFDFGEDGKYIVFWPIFAGIGNNLAVFSEVLLISILSNRKFLGSFFLFSCNA